MSKPRLYPCIFIASLYYCFITCSLALSKTNLTTDESAILALKLSLTPDSDHNLFLTNNWSSSSPLCNWLGVRCDARHGRVKTLDLSNMGLKGTIPPQLGNLSFLVELDLSSNEFYGQVPKEIVHLRRLKLLNLSYNRFDGIIPASLSNLSKLEILDWGSNFITGNIPPEIGLLHHLRALIVEGNKLSGIIPRTISNLSSLEFINFSNNSLSGDIPKEIGYLPQLKVLDLGSNKLSGYMPLTIFNHSELHHLYLDMNIDLYGNLPSSICHGLPKLRELNLYSNQLSGPFPFIWHECKQLIFIDISDNRFSKGSIPSDIGNVTKIQLMYFGNNNLEGDIPKEIGYLPQLKVLDLGSNKLSGYMPLTIFNHSELHQIYLDQNILYGNLPSSICHGLPKIRILRLDSNQLSGPFPFIWHECKQLILIDISNNSFSKGSIPSDIGNLTKIQFMYFVNNNLEGEIPSSIFNISSIREIVFDQNNLRGSFPEDMCPQLPHLETFDLAYNQFGGSIPRSISNCTFLNWLDLSHNAFTGSIPKEIGILDNLQVLSLGFNYLIGSIPSNIFNISSLIHLFLGNNSLSGNLPSDTGHNLPNLQELLLYQNNLIGQVPSTISNASELLQLGLSENQFSGIVPNAFGNLRKLVYLSIYNNNLSLDPSTSEVNFLTSLTNCRNLKSLDISSNPFAGRKLPKSIGNFSDSLQYLFAQDCGIVGYIPLEIGNMSSLMKLYLFGNHLNGAIPTTINKLQHLQGLDFGENGLEGSIINELCELKALEILSLTKNKLSGKLPTCLGNLASLRDLALTANKLISEIPSSIWNLKDILRVDLSSNAFTGPLPLEIGNLRALLILDLSRNQISGSIPITIGSLKTLENLSLAHNKLEGSIPELIGNLVSLEFLDLAQNNLSGVIPKSLESLKYLEYINFSYNKLEGEIPNGGHFKNFNAQSFMLNKALCGIQRFQVPPCNIKFDKRFRTKHLWIKIVLPIIVPTILVVSCAIIILQCRRKNVGYSLEENLPNLGGMERISYHELFRATNGFDDSNLLGKGGFSSVYKGILASGLTVAIKVINLDLEVTERRFDAECEAMCQLRHRNLVKIITSCSNLDFKSLVMEFMPQGSVEKWLYSHNYYLDFLQRLNIMIDVASALEYLHHDSSIPVVHCDVKPSNVLLDEDMIAHLGDFGVAKLLDEGQSRIYTMTMATFGYMAPEYGSEGFVSTKIDVYSYGIMLMEMFIRKKPTDDMFTATRLSLKSWVSDSMANTIMQVVDSNLIQQEGHNTDAIITNTSSILTLALNCCEDSPEARVNMKDVMRSLNKIKINFTQMQNVA